MKKQIAILTTSLAHIERMRLRTRHRTIPKTERTGSSHRVRSDTRRS